jgi:hypothetical protein
MHALGCLAGAAFVVILVVCGDIAAVTSGIPHLGSHGREPSVLGYIVVYVLLVYANVLMALFVACGPIADASS